MSEMRGFPFVGLRSFNVLDLFVAFAAILHFALLSEVDGRMLEQHSQLGVCL